MPSRRFLLVEGLAGHPVTDPHNPSANPARYAGWKLKSEPAVDPDHMLEHYELTQQVIADHPDLQAAIKRGALTKVNECQAKGHEDATAKMAKPAPAPALVKRGDS